PWHQTCRFAARLSGTPTVARFALRDQRQYDTTTDNARHERNSARRHLALGAARGEPSLATTLHSICLASVGFGIGRAVSALDCNAARISIGFGHETAKRNCHDGS